MAKLMLVEDDNNLREIYEARLRAEGYEIIAAKDGEEALVLAKANKPDLIIADVMMPKISGFEMLDILRNTDGLKTVKVIMLTALGQSDDQQRAKSLGADRYLVKSQVTLEDIVKVTHELIGDLPAPAPAAATQATPLAAAVDTPAVAQPATAPVAPIPPATTPPAATPSPGPSAPIAPAPAPVADAPVEPTAPAPAIPAPAPPRTPETPPVEPPASAASIPVAVEPPADDEPTTGDSAATAAADNSAQSTAQEEAGVESRIEDFVAGASEEATSPSATDASEDTADKSDGPESSTGEAEAETAASDAADTASDDKLVADAAQALIDSTEPVPSDPETITIKPTETSKPPQPEPKEPETEDNASGSVPIAHKKVIKPLDDKPKQDLETLLAIETAKEAKTKEQTAASKPLPIIVSDEPGSIPDPKTKTPSLTPPPPPIGSTITPADPETSETESVPAAAPPGSVDPGSIAL
jgi:CheY-like chemotaxis protein